MAVEGEADELSQLPGLDGSHDLLADALEADAVCRPAGLGVGIQVLEILWHGEVEQRHPVVKHRRRAGDLPVWLSRRTPKLPKCLSSL